MRLWELESRLRRTYGSSIHLREGAAVRTDGGEPIRRLFFEYGDAIAPTMCTSKNDVITLADEARIRRNLGILEPEFEHVDDPDQGQ